MEPVTQQLLVRSLHRLAQSTRSTSPVTAALASGLGQGPSPGCLALFDHYFRIISATHLNLPALLAGLHYLALDGSAPELARFLPSCGGFFRPDQDQVALVLAAERLLLDRREELLDFMLSAEPREPEVRRAAALAVGALATAAQFGGGLTLVQLGAWDGLSLLFDRYAYRFGETCLGDAPLTLSAALSGRLPAGSIPAVTGRFGLDPAPADLTDPAQRRMAEAFIAPDQTERLERFRAACTELERGERPDLRRGVAELDLPRLLVEAYNAMPPGNTLLLFSLMAWSELDDEAQKRVALGLQSLAAQVRPHKPIAWFQAEPLGPGERLELRLHTFGWADLEDRAVRRLGEADRDLAWIRLAE
ncbi:MAG: DUF2332 family protein [Bacillota bacterium]